MTELGFFKVHGLGNDFILVDAIAQPEAERIDWPAAATRLCRRHTGIGADGVLLLGASENPAADVRMRIFNADGSEAQMCGNGIRCIARHLVVRRGWPGEVLRVLTPRGTLPITFERSGEAFMATVDMGEPILIARDVPVMTSARQFIDQLIVLDFRAGERVLKTALAALGPSCRTVEGGVEVRATAVSMGNPHAVVLVSSAAGVPLEDLGSALESHPSFPQKTNAHFLEVTGPGHAILRTWERGAGPTLACGTGACAALVTGVLAGRLQPSAVIRVPGGELRIRWDREADRLFMTGPAEEVFQGRLPADLA